jgi:hypothetical protein
VVNSFRVASRESNDRSCGNCIEEEFSVKAIGVGKVGNGYSRNLERKSWIDIRVNFYFESTRCPDNVGLIEK